MTIRGFTNQHLAAVLMFVATVSMKLTSQNENRAYNEAIIRQTRDKAEKLSNAVNL